MRIIMALQKALDLIEENLAYILCAIVVMLIAGIIAVVITAPNLTEGMVMNKRFSPGYFYSVDGNTYASKDRWIIEVQNGDQKDWWTVTESYYDAVSLGEWVTK